MEEVGEGQRMPTFSIFGGGGGQFYLRCNWPSLVRIRASRLVHLTGWLAGWLALSLILGFALVEVCVVERMRRTWFGLGQLMVWTWSLVSDYRRRDGKICWLCCVLSPVQLSALYLLFPVNKSVTISQFLLLTGWLALSFILGFGRSWRGGVTEERMQTFFSLLLFLLFSLDLVAVCEEEIMRTWVDFVIWWALLTFVIWFCLVWFGFCLKVMSHVCFTCEGVLG